jgi:hypothetical protein
LVIAGKVNDKRAGARGAAFLLSLQELARARIDSGHHCGEAVIASAKAYSMRQKRPHAFIRQAVIRAQ